MGSHNCILARVKSLLALTLAGIGWAQPVTVYSDMADIDLTGKVTAPETPREILSPALVRNGFTSFQIVVQAPTEARWWLFVGENPEDSVKIAMYRLASTGGTLEPVELPRRSSGTEVFWMDVWTDHGSPVQRVKIEPEVYLNDDWVTYPIEARVMAATITSMPQINAQMPPMEFIRPAVCSDGSVGGSYLGTVPRALLLSEFRFRNAEQDLDLILSGKAPKTELRRLFGDCNGPLPKDPEWYLRIRDYLFRLPALN